MEGGGDVKNNVTSMIAALADGGYPAREVGEGVEEGVGEGVGSGVCGVAGGDERGGDGDEGGEGEGRGRGGGGLEEFALRVDGPGEREGTRKEHGRNMEEFALRVDGITCGACVSRIEKGLGRVDGVEFVSVSLANNTALVGIDRQVCVYV